MFLLQQPVESNKTPNERLTQPTHIVVATPGRLIDLIQRKAINLKETNFLVLDEADESLILKESLDEIIAELPKDHKTLLFSATTEQSSS
jgi:ATP-dependent RNA helicase DeaD